MNEADNKQFQELAEVMGKMSKIHWHDFLESRGSEGATFAEWKPVFLRDMRDTWRDEFPKPEHWRAIRKLIIDPLLEYVARERIAPGTRTVSTRHAKVAQLIEVADYKLETGDPRAEEYVAMAREAVRRADGDLDTPLISVSDRHRDGGPK